MICFGPMKLAAFGRCATIKSTGNIVASWRRRRLIDRIRGRYSALSGYVAPSGRSLESSKPLHMSSAAPSLRPCGPLARIKIYRPVGLRPPSWATPAPPLGPPRGVGGGACFSCCLLVVGGSSMKRL